MTKDDLMATCLLVPIKNGSRLQCMATGDLVMICHGNDPEYKEEMAFEIMGMLVEYYLKKAEGMDLDRMRKISYEIVDAFPFVRKSKVKYGEFIIYVEVNIPEGLKLVERQKLKDFAEERLKTIQEVFPDVYLFSAKLQNYRTAILELKLKQ